MYDLLFRQATIVDGTGALRYAGDLAVQGDAIAAMGRLNGAKAKRTIDAKGLALCPGFIDVHSHADLVVFRDNAAELFEPLLRQGITTFVGGNCGMGLAPIFDNPNRKYIDAYHEGFTSDNLRPLIKWSTLAEFMGYLDRRGVPANTALLAPHGVMRLAAVGARAGHANRDEIAQMSRWLEAAMEQGAFGLSTGLQYVPGNLSDTGELIDLARVTARYGGRFTCHLRSYSATLQKAVDELVLIGREAGLPVQLSHLFWVPDFNVPLNRAFRAVALAGSALYRRVKFPVPSDSAASKVLAQVAALRRSGDVQIAVDAMPTSTGFTHLIAFFPPWVFAQASDLNVLTNTLRDKKKRREIRRSIETGDTHAWPHDQENTWSMNFMKIMGYASISIMSVPSEQNRHLEGMNLVEIGKLWKMHPFDAACELLVQEGGKVLVFETLTHPGDDFVETSVRAPMGDPNTSIVTDAIMMGYGLPSHLFYDCYPKFLQRYVRETKVVTLEDGVRKCTSLPAESLGIKKRGALKPGNFADLALFDPEKIKTNATAKDPRRFPDGIKLVVVNGKIVVEGDKYHKATMAGRVLRRS
jgi:N-acyl-D-amino-acid deacylase